MISSRSASGSGFSSRRRFLRLSLAGTAGALALPTIVPSSVLGQDAPSNKIQIAQIGCGRIAHDMDMPGILKQDRARIVAVCDLDSKRAAHAKKRVEAYYPRKRRRKAVAVKTSSDYRELLQEKGIDAVAISTPDHWHAELVIAAALAGKDIYVQKPLSMTLAEGRAVSDIVRAKGRAFQIGSQQRSTLSVPHRLRVGPQRAHRQDCTPSKSACPVDPSGGDDSGKCPSRPT